MECAAERLHAASHRTDPHSTDVGLLETNAVIDNLELEAVGLKGRRERGRRGLGVPHDIGGRFQQHEVGGLAHCRRKIAYVDRDRERRELQAVEVPAR